PTRPAARRRPRCDARSFAEVPGMRKWAAVLVALLAVPGVAQAAAVRSDALRAAFARAGGAQPVWVFLKDKGPAAVGAPLSPRAVPRLRRRRAREVGGFGPPRLSAGRPRAPPPPRRPEPAGRPVERGASASRRRDRFA